MGKVHETLKTRGKQATLQLDFDRQVVDAAASYLSSEDTDVSFLFSGWAYSALPHRRLPDDAVWTLSTDHASVVVQPGVKILRDGTAVPVGVPYGSRARLIMLYLQSEAVKNNSRDVELGRSMNDWLKRMGIPVGGRTTNDVKNQAERVARCRLTFQFWQGNVSGLANQHILDQALFMEGSSKTSNSFLETARLSEGYFEQLKKHPLPVEEAAIKQISNNSMAIDVYIWLAYRLHVLQKPTHVTWLALYDQFGSGFSRIDNFRTRFRDSLALAMAVYPSATLDVRQSGLLLHPSKPPAIRRSQKYIG